MSHLKDILGGLAVTIVALAVVVGVFGGAIYTAHQNSLKVQRMTQLCLSKGYSGWEDSGRDGSVRCDR